MGTTYKQPVNVPLPAGYPVDPKGPPMTKTRGTGAAIKGDKHKSSQ